MSLTALAAIAVSTFADLPVCFIWNGSASAPVGLYWVSPRPFTTGDLVLARLDLSARKLMTERGYLPPNVTVLKRIAALEGDEICRLGDEISINGRMVATALAADFNARPLPIWSGCHVLKAHEILLLNDHPKSLDGRYFGPTKRALVIGRARFLWALP